MKQLAFLLAILPTLFSACGAPAFTATETKGTQTKEIKTKSIKTKATTEVVVVEVRWPGASPEELEAGVVSKIESVLQSVQGLQRMTTEIQEGTAAIRLAFNGLEGNAALRAVNEKLGKATIPDDAEKPTIRLESAAATFWLILTGVEPQDVTAAEAKDIEARIERIVGVGNATIYGLPERSLRLRVDPLRLQDKDISHAELAEALPSNENLAKLSPEDVEQLNVRIADRKPIMLSALAEARLVERPAKAAFYNGKPVIAFAVEPKRDADQPGMLSDLKELIEQLKESKKGQLELAIDLSADEKSESSHVVRAECLLPPGPPDTDANAHVARATQQISQGISDAGDVLCVIENNKALLLVKFQGEEPESFCRQLSEKLARFPGVQFGCTLATADKSSGVLEVYLCGKDTEDISRRASRLLLALKELPDSTGVLSEGQEASTPQLQFKTKNADLVSAADLAESVQAAAKLLGSLEPRDVPQVIIRDSNGQLRGIEEVAEVQLGKVALLISHLDSERCQRIRIFFPNESKRTEIKPLVEKVLQNQNRNAGDYLVD